MQGDNRVCSTMHQFDRQGQAGVVALHCRDMGIKPIYLPGIGRHIAAGQGERGTGRLGITRRLRTGGKQAGYQAFQIAVGHQSGGHRHAECAAELGVGQLVPPVQLARPRQRGRRHQHQSRCLLRPHYTQAPGQSHRPAIALAKHDGRGDAQLRASLGQMARLGRRIDPAAVQTVGMAQTGAVQCGDPVVRRQMLHQVDQITQLARRAVDQHHIAAAAHGQGMHPATSHRDDLTQRRIAAQDVALAQPDAKG